MLFEPIFLTLYTLKPPCRSSSSSGEVGGVDDVVEDVHRQAEERQVRSGQVDPGAPYRHTTVFSPEGHVVARQVLDGEAVADVGGLGLAADDVVEEDGLDGGVVGRRGEAADEAGQGGVGGREDRQVRVAAEGADEVCPLHQREERVQPLAAEAGREGGGPTAAAAVAAAAPAAAVAVAVAARAPLAVAAPAAVAAGPGGGQGG